MTDLQRSLRKFYFRLSLRVASYAALWGLVLALPVVIAAPWLRDWYGMPGYWATMALPIILPAFYAAIVLFVKPAEREQVLAADYWFGDTGSIVSAYELEKARPGDPFVEPVSRQAQSLMHDKPLPEPRWLRRALIALVILLLLTPLSRWAYAQMEERKQEDEKQKQAKKPDVKPADAEEVAKSAGEAAEKAKAIGSKQQEKLAEDLEEAARRAQAKADDKEKAMRDANAVADRAKAQAQGQEDRQAARDAMKDKGAAEELRKAIESNDPRRVEEAIRKITDEIYKENGEIDTATANEMKKAVEAARQAAPNDPAVKRAADAADEQLKKAKEKGEHPDAEKKAEEALENKMRQDDPKVTGAEIERAKEEMRRENAERRQVEAAEMKKALEELAKAIDPKRDIDPTGKRAEEIRKQVEKGEITPEQAEAMVKAARELAKQMEIDAETLKEMIKQGKDFEGMEEVAKRIAEQAKKDAQDGKPTIGPEDVPDWVKKAMQDKEWQEIAKKLAKEAAERKGEPGQPGEGKEGKPGEGKVGPDGKPIDDADGKPGDTKIGPDGRPVDGGEGKVGPDGKPIDGKDGSGKDGGGGKGETTGPDGKPIDPKEVRKEGVDVKDTGKGEKDPDAERKELDAKKAAEERAKREATGRKGTGDDVNTKEELDRLPRRYRDAARKYFERK